MTGMSNFKPKHFNWRVDGKVAHITLQRPERKNPMTFDFLCRSCATLSARSPMPTISRRW